jgi:hypothetical protein
LEEVDLLESEGPAKPHLGNAVEVCLRLAVQTYPSLRSGFLIAMAVEMDEVVETDNHPSANLGFSEIFSFSESTPVQSLILQMSQSYSRLIDQYDLSLLENPS